MSTTPASPIQFDIICAPTEAGTHFPGQCKAPDWVLHKGRLQELLSANPTHNVTTHNKDHNGIFGEEMDAATHWTPSPKTSGVRNLPNTMRVMHALHSYLLTHTPTLRSSFPIILGGDCSITPAILSAFTHWHPDRKVGLLYVDGDADLTLPSQTSAEGSSGILDSMVMSHLTARDGGLEPMKAFSRPAAPLVTPDNVVLFGFDPLQLATEHWVYLLENGFKCFTRPSVQRAPVACAREALQYLEERVDVIVLHFDVDVIDSAAFPLANYPHYAGLGFEEAMSAVETFLGCEKVRGLVITEINPNNDVIRSGERSMVERLVGRLVTGLSKRRTMT